MSSKKIMYCFWVYVLSILILPFFGYKILELHIIILVLIPIHANIVSHIEDIKKAIENHGK